MGASPVGSSSSPSPRSPPRPGSTTKARSRSSNRRAAPLAGVVALFLLGSATAAGCGDDDEEPTAGGSGETTPRREAPRPEPPPVGDGRGGVRLVEVGEFEQPLYVAQPPGESRDLYVVEKGGRIVVVEDGKPASEPFLDLSGEVSTGSEQGLLSMAFAPDYSRSGRFYVNFTDTQGDTRIQEFRRAADGPGRADPDTRRELLRIDQPFENHNGGLLLFGPDDLLYVGTGDGGAAGGPMRHRQDPPTPP